MNRLLRAALLSLVLPLLSHAQTTQPPRIAGEQLLVGGKPYLLLGGELSNSAAGTAAAAAPTLAALRAQHLNTVLMPVAWDQMEPSEGHFDFALLDAWIAAARHEQMHLVLLWFGSWKNSASGYAPAWIKQHPERFPRARAADGTPTEILSTLGTETLHADQRAFVALLAHLAACDAVEQTVLMVQVENEVGFLGQGRDRSPEADALFRQPVPQALLSALARQPLREPLRSHFNANGKNWAEVFGAMADEQFMAWNYARYIEAVAAAGKRAYPLPLYVNCQLPAWQERAGEYPSGGPHPDNLDMWRAAAPSLDLFAPDIYWPDFAQWVDRYRSRGQAVFVPETRLDAAPYNAFYALGEAHGFGFSPFDVDHMRAAEVNAPLALGEVYAVLEHLTPELLAAQASNRLRGLVLHTTSPRASQTLALSGYLFTATIARSWPARLPLSDTGALLVLATTPDEFLVAGSGLTVSFERDADTDNQLAGVTSIEQLRWEGGAWQVERRLNGDESNQGRQLMMDAHRMGVYRVRLHHVSR